MAWAALILMAVSLTALAAVVAAGAGPVRSLTRTMRGLRGLRGEADDLRRNLDLLEQRRRDIADGVDNEVVD